MSVVSKTLSVSQIQKVEDIAIKKIGIPSVVLMENAGKAVAVSVSKYLRRKTKPNIVVVCGAGNNGGDGMVAARHLSQAGIKVKVYLAGSLQDLKSDPKIFCNVLYQMGIPVTVVKKINSDFINSLKGADVTVDALFGIGLNRPIEGLYREIVECMNRYTKRIWAVDIPSGLDGTSGHVWGAGVRAFKTVSFTCLKKGFFIHNGPQCVGNVDVADIGIPLSVIQRIGK